MKNPFKRKKNPVPQTPPEPPTPAPEPRSKEEIQKEVDQTITKIGFTEYQIFVHKQNLASLNNRAVSLAHEQQARAALDKAAEETAAKEETTNAQS